MDSKGNTHILDYVMEEGGSEAVQGRPRAFIEIAWRRYTKHSKNKAQEIQGAITPLAETYQDSHPFLGAVLAGEFTEPSNDTSCEVKQINPRTKTCPATLGKQTRLDVLAPVP